MKKLFFFLCIVPLILGVLYSGCHFDKSGIPMRLHMILNPPPDACTGQYYEFTFAAAGGSEPYTWTVVLGQLPDGLSLDSATGTLSGTPTVNGTYTFTIEVMDAANETILEEFTMSTDDFTISTTNIDIFCPGLPFSQQLTTCGGEGQLTWSFIDRGNLPGTVNLSSDGVLSGTIQTADTYTFAVGVVDGSSNTAQKQFTVEITGDLVFATHPVLPEALTDVPYSTVLQVCGGVSPYSFAMTGGSLPSGLQLNSLTGEIAGTICNMGTGQYTFQIEATDGSTTPQTTPARTFLIQVVPSPLTIVTPSGNQLPDAVACDAYPAFTFEATGGSGSCSGNYQWSIQGVMPAGINGLSLDPATGVLSGVPVVPTPAPYTFTIQVADQVTNETDSRTVMLTVNENMQVDPDMIIDNLRHDYYPGHTVSREIDISGDTGYLVRIDFHFDPNSATQLIRDLDTQIQNGNVQIVENAHFRVVGCCDEVFTTNFTDPPQDIDGDGRNEATARFNEVAVRDYLINQAGKGAGDTVTIRMTVQVFFEGVHYYYVNRLEGILIVP